MATPTTVTTREHTPTAWTVAGFGLLAFVMAIFGLVSPARQRSMTGLEEPDERGPGDHTPDPQGAGVGGSHRSLRLINRPTRLEGTPPDRGGLVGEVVGSSVGPSEQPQHSGVRP